MNRIQIKARGFTFDAWSDGPEEGPLLLLLHGLPRTSWEWHHQIPKLAEAGFRTVAPDLRGFCPGARPKGVEAYIENEYVQDILAIADQLGWADRPFHLIPHRVATLACINIPHPMAFTEVMATKAAEKQQQKMSYVNDSKIEGNELKMFELTLKIMHLPAEETDPYNFYRALKIQPLKPIIMPTLYIWPRNAGNISQEAAEANAHYIKGAYRFEILEVARNFALQKEPELITRLLLEHLAEHAQ